jgi:HAD superfamily hydrolase (TIGR01509 family)
MIRAILWDNDGVLVDTEGLYFQATREILSKVGVELTQRMYAKYSLKHGKSVWHLAAEKGASPEEVKGMREERNALYAQLLQQGNTLIDGVEKTLDNLHGQFLMGIVTSSRPEHFEVIHQQTGLLKYFDFVITSLYYTNFKPDPEPYLVGWGRTGLEKDECVVIEDSARGLTAANAAGIRCLVIPNDLAPIEDFAAAYMILNDINDVTPELLQSM